MQNAARDRQVRCAANWACCERRLTMPTGTDALRGRCPLSCPRDWPNRRRARRRGSELGYVLHIDGARIGDIKRGFAAACLRAGICGVTPHTLRHTCATWLMQAGTDLWEASGFLSMSMETLQR